MSGGAFEYEQYKIGQIADQIEHEIETNNKKPTEPYMSPNNFSDETIAEFKKGVQKLREAQIYAQRIDWLLSADDGEDTFHKRLKKDLDEHEIERKTQGD